MKLKNWNIKLNRNTENEKGIEMPMIFNNLKR